MVVTYSQGKGRVYVGKKFSLMSSGGVEYIPPIQGSGDHLRTLVPTIVMVWNIHDIIQKRHVCLNTISILNI